MMFLMFYILVAANAVPLGQTPGEKCFAGGFLMKELQTTGSYGEVCLKDDVSMIRSVMTTTKQTGTLIHKIKYYRLYTNKDWQACNPVKSADGNVMILGVDHDNFIKYDTYSCRQTCDISIDKQTGEISLISPATNHFEITGTTIQKGWFRKTITIPLEHTCEHITISCGTKIMDIHSCFRVHKSCTRFFKGTYMPLHMIESFCENIELILLLTYITIVFIFLMIMTKTYIIYLMLPIFYIPTFIYGKLYNKYFKLCKLCLLAIHPFTSCGCKCICGCVLNSTDALRTHRLSGLCPGYKSLSKARYCCKSKGCSFATAVLTGFLIFTFLTPINAQELDIQDYRDLPKAMIEMSNNINTLTTQIYILKLAFIFVITILTIIYYFNENIITHIFNKLNVHCSLCGMIHSKSGLNFNSIVTNKCGTCTCGYSEHVYNGGDYEIRLDQFHKTTELCRLNVTKQWNNKLKCFVTVLFLLTIIPVALSNDDICLADNKLLNIDQLDQCAFSYQLNKECSDDNFKIFKNSQIIEKYGTEDYSLINKSDSEVWNIIEKTTNLNLKAFYERLFYEKNCHQYKGLTQFASPSNIGWRTYIKGHHLHVCSYLPYRSICKCISEDRTDFCEVVLFNYDSKIKNYYTTNPKEAKTDLETILKTIKIALPGINSFLIDYRYAMKNKEKLNQLLTGQKYSLGKNEQLKAIIELGSYILNHSSNLLQNLQRSAPQFENHRDLVQVTTTQFVRGTIDIKICENAQTLICKKSRSEIITHTFLLCGQDNANHVYKDPDFNTIARSDNAKNLCAYDSHCNFNFTQITQGLFEKIGNDVCTKKQKVENPGEMKESQIKCHIDKLGECTTLDKTNWPVVMCSNGLYYYSTGSKHSNDLELNSHCIVDDCKTSRLPIAKEYFKNCTWIENHRTRIEIQKHSYNSLESYRKFIEEEFSSNLLLGEFKKTSDFPKVKPVYKGLYIEGTISADGIQNAFIKSQIPAIAGTSAGIKLKTPDGSEISDIIVYIKKSYIKASYSEIYKTGPTIGINVKHDEQCTGKCPIKIPKNKENWLTFSKEHTSNWGCEEFGCLAVESGCLYGSCQDIIQPMLDVYKMFGTESPIIEICVLFSSESYCHKLTSLEPAVTEKFQISFSTVQTASMPKILAIKNMNIYTGQINDLGVVSKSCGSVQYINKTLYGSGDVKFDYICHLARRKDVIVRKCFDNNYEYCKLLTKRNDMLINKQPNQNAIISLTNVNLGIIDFKLELGDINYKLFRSDPSFEVTGSCAGCINCAEQISCEFIIESPETFTCPISSDCELYHDSILINPTDKIHYMKVSCRDKLDKLTFKICTRRVEIPVVLRRNVQKLDLSKLDESAYIIEEDHKCPTWICKVEKEGLNVIFDTIFGGLNRYVKYALLAFLFVIGILLTLYFLIPLCKRLKGCLERNEIEYQMEMKYK
ncbi:glycoprotein precursor [Belmont virus]|nr:glycoprotein precursor [Belmont virus]